MRGIDIPEKYALRICYANGIFYDSLGSGIIHKYWISYKLNERKLGTRLYSPYEIGEITHPLRYVKNVSITL